MSPASFSIRCRYRQTSATIDKIREYRKSAIHSAHQLSDMRRNLLILPCFQDITKPAYKLASLPPKPASHRRGFRKVTGSARGAALLRLPCE
ncbi:MAG: hypothetical protein KGM99_07690 [Burkholderiales bacterium]|nr:hypothetical protein [Burkholderiales bacterium]